MIQLPLEMYRTYIVRRKDDLKSLEEALQRNSVTSFNQIGHQIMGNAQSFGFSELEKIGEKMESLRPEDVQAEGRRLIDDLAHWIQQTEVEYQNQQ